MERNCENCDYWHCIEIAEKGKDEEYPSWGQCRRFPPVQQWEKSGERNFPEDCAVETGCDWWCGEFKPKSKTMSDGN